MENKTGIYKIKNLVNNKLYIGQSININIRFANHKSDLRYNHHDNKHLQSSWNKYGEENFEFEIIELTTEGDLDERERYWIKYHNSTDKKFGYNSQDGGNLNKHYSEESKRKMSESHKGLNSGKNHPMYGKKLSQEHKEKLLKANLGKICSDKTKEKISLANKGRIMTEDTRKKISQANKNPSKETREKLSKLKKGENNPKYGDTKFNKEQVVEIRNKYDTHNYSLRQLAKEYKTTHSIIGDIIYYRRAYSHEKEQVVDRTTKNISNVRTDKIVEILFDILKVKPYVIEKELIDELSADGEINTSKKEAEKQVKKSLQEILLSYDLKRIRCNKKIKEQYNVDAEGYPFLIVKNN